MDTEIMNTMGSRTMPTILCCMCGIPIPANPANMCVNCIRGQVDITDGIPKQLMMIFCKGCGRYLNPPTQWLPAELESKELLALCIKKIKGLNKVKLVDAGFIWTEPHSRRIKVKLTVQKEVFTGTILQQIFVVEFTVTNQQCDNCSKFEAKDTWNACVQIRQRAEHKKTFFFLEQLIIKHSAHTNCINIKDKPDGLDFFYGHRSHALKMLDFLQAVVPIRFKTGEKLVSQDDNSNTFNYKYTFSVEIVPICRDDVACLPSKLARSMGLSSPLLLCTKVSSLVSFVDPFTGNSSDINSNTFWSNPFRSILSTKQLIQYVVLDISPIKHVGRYVIADIQVAKASDFGSNDTIYNARTHLGNSLKPGDYALGYDVSNGNFNDDDISGMRGKDLPELVLVKKTYPERRRKNRSRHWKLKQLNKEAEDSYRPHDQEREGRDYESFMQDLEEDKELRSQIALFKEKNAEQIYKQHQTEAEDDMAENGEDFPEVGLEELMEDLVLDSIDDDEGEEVE